MHGLTPEGMDVVEDSLMCINMLIYYGTPKGCQIAPEMWKLLPQIMYMVAGQDDDVDGGYGFEFLNLVSPCVQNYIAKDPKTLLLIGEGQSLTYLELVFKFIQRLLVVNSNGVHKLDGINAMKVLIALMENLPGMIDHALPNFIGMLLAELKHAQNTKGPQHYTLMVIQALCGCLFNNCTLALQIIEKEHQTVPFFTALLSFMPNFKREFEIRRILFGLTAIFRSPLDHIPPLIVQK